MYPLYELVRLISFGHGSRATLAPKVAIVDFAWREVGEANMLALVCSNGYVVLRCCISGKEPTIRQLPWYDDRPIVSLCFDPTATWLLILTSDSELYIVPALSLLEPGARVNQLWQVDDVTSMGIIPQPKEPSVLCWWHTLDDYQVALVGTKQGKVVCVDLRRRHVLTEVAVNGAVSGLSLIQDDDQMSTHLLVTLEEGQQLKVLLECQNSAAYRRKISEVDWTDVGYDPVESDIVSLIHQTESNKHLFYPLKFYQFKPSVQLSPQHAKGRHFIGCHDSKTCQYQIMDSGLEQSALFVYQAPEGAYNLIFSDKVTFCTTDADGKKLSILSNQKAETSMTDKQVFNKDAIFQQFSLPEGEELKAVLKKSFPFYWHEKREEMGRTTPQPIADIERVSHDGEAESIRISSHTVMDGCIVITDTSVYECRPRVSPERLFLDFAIHHSDPSVAESLGIGLGLDVNSLFERVAEYKLTKGEFHQAIRLYQLSKCSHAKRVASFASHGCIPEVMTYLKQVLTNQKTDVNTGEKKPLADMALYCFVHQIQESGTASGSVLASFRDFLLGSFSYNEKTALKLLAKHRLNDLLLELAKARGLILEALQVMVEDGRFDISTDAAQSLVSRGFGAHLARVNEGAFLRCMNPCEMAALLCTKPYLAVSHLDSLEPTLPHLDETHLVNLARIFDPSKPLIGAALNRGHAGRNRTASVNSLASFTSEFGDALSQESTGPDVTRLIHFFLSIVLMLNKKRGPPKEVRLLAAMEADPVSDNQMKREDSSSSGHLELALRPSPIGCGSQHAALVRNGDLYTWGRSHAGRLGHGDLSPDHSICAATRVESLHMLQIRVISVACGGEHTLALTQQGVYGWGSSRFGQVGAGTRDQSYSRPMLLEGLSEQGCVSIQCGHYHSLALTASGSVYSWGWGVHGQLGHGTAEDCLVPTRIQALSAHMVTSVAGGHCHTVALTAQGEVYTFGCGLFGQLGHGSGFKESLPRKVQDLPGKVLQVATKCFHTLALLNNNRVYSWGSHPMVLRQTAHMIKRSRSGAGGHHQGDVVDQFLVPCPVDMSYVHGKIAQVSCGSYHNTLLTTEGEVFVWGRNIDGQLGNGSRQDVKHPVMLTSVNDRSISHMACGSEFNIAMDTDALIWVWGKNEAGQLGMGRPENQPHTTIRPGRKHAASAMYDVIQPTTLSAIPPVTITTSWQRVARSLSVDSTDSGGPLVWSLGGYEDSDPQLYLPELETVSSPCYSTKVIHVILKHLGERCNLSRLSRECVDLRDWLSAAEVHIYQQHYPQALGYTFRHLSSERQNLGNLEEFLSLTQRVLDFHIRELEQYPLPGNQQFLSWRLILLKVFQFWEENKLPVCHLETTLTSHMDVFIAPLGLILFRADESGKSIGVSQRIRKQLKTKFLLTVLSKFLEMIKGEEISGEVSKAFGECLNPGDSPESSVPSLSSGSKLIPYDRLWHEVLQNVRKDWDMHNYVYLTARDIELLQTQGKRRGMVSAGEVIDGSELKNADESSVVVFSCGHHSNSRTFHSHLVQSLNRDLGMGQNALPKTASLLTQCYNRKGFIPMACPGCVVKAVQAV